MAQSQGLAVESLFHEQLSVVVRASHPLTSRGRLELTDLLGEKWIAPRINAVGRPLFEAVFRQLGLEPPEPSVETGDLSTLRQLLACSDMLAAISPSQVMIELRAGLLRVLPVALPGTLREVGLILRDGAMLSPAVQAVLELVRAEAMARQAALWT
jgi:LysR family transcriptional regulator of gallate degradation